MLHFNGIELPKASSYIIIYYIFPGAAFLLLTVNVTPYIALFQYVDGWQPKKRRLRKLTGSATGSMIYAGEEEGQNRNMAREKLHCTHT